MKPEHYTDIKTEHFAYRVIWSQKDGEHVGLCTEFPSLSHLDKGHEAALNGIIQLVQEVVRDMQANGETVPEPLSTKNYSGKLVVRIPAEQHRSLTMNAREQGISLNRYISSKLAC